MEESLDEDTDHIQSQCFLDRITSMEPKAWTATILVSGEASTD